MKAKRSVCTQCGAQLQILPGTDRIRCEYCGSVLMLGKGEVSEYASPDESRDLAERIHAMVGPWKERQSLETEHEKLKEECGILSRNAEFAESYMGKYLPYAVAAFGATAGLFVAIVMKSGLMFLFLLGMSALAGFILHKEEERSVTSLKEKTERCAQITERLKVLDRENDFDLIPSEYRTEDAMTSFYRYLRGSRARNLTEAINLYEDEKYKLEMKRLQEEQLAVQKEKMEAEKQMHREKMKLKRDELKKMKENSDKTEINIDMDGLAAAGGLLAAGTFVYKALKDVMK